MSEEQWGFDPESPSQPDDGFFGMNVPIDEAKVVILPVPFEGTACYGRGTSGGPEAMRRASHHLDFYDIDTGRPYRAGIATAHSDPSHEIAALNAVAITAVERLRGREVLSESDRRQLHDEVDAIGAKVNDMVGEQARAFLDRGQLVATIGGDHSIPFGAISAAAERHKELGILHIDAHADLRDAYGGFRWSHASIMRNVLDHLPQVTRLVQVGIRDFTELEVDTIAASNDRIITYFDRDIQEALLEGKNFAEQCLAFVEDLPDTVYVSFDIDGLDPVLCPQTGTPVPGGLQFQQACFLLKTLVRSRRRIIGFDLCEVADAEWDANVGARILYKLIGFALKSQGITH